MRERPFSTFPCHFSPAPMHSWRGFLRLCCAISTQQRFANWTSFLPIVSSLYLTCPFSICLRSRSFTLFEASHPVIVSTASRVACNSLLCCWGGSSIIAFRFVVCCTMQSLTAATPRIIRLYVLLLVSGLLSTTSRHLGLPEDAGLRIHSPFTCRLSWRFWSDPHAFHQTCSRSACFL